MRKVIHATANDDFTLELHFDDGKAKVFDMRPFLKYPVFKKLKDPVYFKDIQLSFGTVQWRDEQDMSPDTLYLDGIEIEAGAELVG
jgi:hypothetical protein